MLICEVAVNLLLVKALVAAVKASVKAWREDLIVDRPEFSTDNCVLTVAL